MLKPIEAPSNCPSCMSVLNWSNNVLYCLNTGCHSQNQKKIEHFAKTMKIKGLGPASISKLDLYDIGEIYILELEEMTNLLGSEKVASKLIVEIENSKKAPANSVLPAFSIPLIGKSATEKLSRTCKNIFEIDEDTCVEAGLGPVATANLLKWYYDEFESGLDTLPLNFAFKRVAVVPTNKGTVCISGKLTSYKNKAEATEALTRCGYAVKGTVTKAVSVLVNESGIESAKTKSARKSGITIVNNLQEFLGEI